MPTSATHYDTLKVAPDAPMEVIQAAYRSLARLYHPDRAGSSSASEATMKAINEAYRVLSDPAERANYDQALARQRTWGGRGHAPSGGRGGDARETSTATIVLAICYVLAALTLLRLPGAARALGVLMLIGGYVILQLRSRPSGGRRQ